jgi:hypothetical protein
MVAVADYVFDANDHTGQPALRAGGKFAVYFPGPGQGFGFVHFEENVEVGVGFNIRKVMRHQLLA